MFSKLKALFAPPPAPPAVADAVLGTVAFDTEEQLWTSTVQIDGQAFKVNIAGVSSPDPSLLELARRVAEDARAFRQRLSSFLTQQGALANDTAGELSQLEMESLNLFWPDRPDSGMVFFREGSAGQIWHCDYINGEFGGLACDR